MIRTGADLSRVDPRFRPVHEAAVDLVAPDQRIGLEQLLAWTVTAQGVAADTVAEVLDETVGAIVAAFSDLIGLWPDSTHAT